MYGVTFGQVWYYFQSDLEMASTKLVLNYPSGNQDRTNTVVDVRPPSHCSTVHSHTVLLFYCLHAPIAVRFASVGGLQCVIDLS